MAPFGKASRDDPDRAVSAAEVQDRLAGPDFESLDQEFLRENVPASVTKRNAWPRTIAANSRGCRRDVGRREKYCSPMPSGERLAGP